MLDIHNHILPAVDDGAQNIEEADVLLKNAVIDGISELILTPHYVHGEEYCVPYAEIERRFDEYRRHAEEKGIRVRLHLGNEIMINKHLDTLLDEKKVHTLADSSYILVEFPMDRYSEEYDEYLYNARISGYRIIIAHPERYQFVRSDADMVRRWTDEGYLLQCNADNLKHRKKAKVVHYLLEKGLCSFMASDGHNERRPVILSPAYREIEKTYGKEFAERLFVINPECILRDEPVEDMPLKPKRRWL